jgi:hypothetical protein
MLAAAMRRRLAIAVLVAALAAGILGACGEDETLSVKEGEPVELGDLSYNIQITRFLNPDDTEDGEYLVDQPPPDPGTSYLGVFLTIENDNDDEALPSADEYTIVDTLKNEYTPIPSDSPYALDLGAPVPADGDLPVPDSTAASGPIEGALLIFKVDDAVAENRPLELEIPTDSGTGRVELDI